MFYWCARPKAAICAAAAKWRFVREAAFGAKRSECLQSAPWCRLRAAVRCETKGLFDLKTACFFQVVERLFDLNNAVMANRNS
jgi:hypothetical protein